MGSARYEIDKFTGKNDFGIWKVKMMAVLTLEGLDEAVVDSDETFKDETKEQREKMINKARSTIFLSLDDKVLRNVYKEESAAAVWKKLESLYVDKSVANRLYMKQRLYSCEFSEERSVLDQLDEFNKAVDDLEIIGVEIDDEDKALYLLNALPKSYSNLKDAMLRGRADSISLEEVQSAVKGNEIVKMSDGFTHENNGEGLLVKIGKFNKNPRKPPFDPRTRQSNQSDQRVCHYCKKPGHLIKYCAVLKQKGQCNQGTNTVKVIDDNHDEALNAIAGPVEEMWIF